MTSSVDIFNAKGEKLTLTSADLEQGSFNTAGGETGLVAAIKEYCKR